MGLVLVYQYYTDWTVADGYAQLFQKNFARTSNFPILLNSF